MFEIDPKDIINTGDIKKFKKKIGLIVKKHQFQVLKEITDYAKKINLTLILDIKFDVKIVGKKKW